MKKKFCLILTSLLLFMCGFFSFTSAPKAKTKQIDYVPNQLIVKFKDSPSFNSIQNFHTSLGATVLSKDDTLGFEVVQFNKGTVQEKMKAYKNNPDVEYAEPNYYFHAFWTPNDPYFGSQYGLQKIKASQAWDSERSDSGVKVAIVDTGVQGTHPDLASKVIYGHDYVENDDESDDENGHGTHCAGIAGALTDNDEGIAGVAPQSSIYAVRVLDSQGSGTLASVAQGIREAADAGAQVISLSLGATSGGTALQQAVQYAWNKGAVIVAAAGNAGNTKPNYPAYYSEVIAVASTDQSDKKSYFSTYGSWVDVAAPGSSIYSTYIGDSYETLSGTSMATPHVAGVAALLANQGYNNTEIRQIIEMTADKISGTGRYWTNGRINADKAVQYGAQLKEKRAS
ncbi:peptidase S8 [Bacillus thuringiensis LM1212]|uniref:S8 family peptidase n=1 Tax=Bacillus cereus group TaxID=86661 RepID=UPI0004026BD2|nr:MULTISPECIES: S8 family peptidase [Bacillus cereus group]AXY08564.1 peptidase S8 [Bacillus thuringiensis LM1212]QDF26853.1 peptidase S8 [Bacillus tropicus]QUG94803.1 peptidase S8 [Bacillus tropicus]